MTRVLVFSDLDGTLLDAQTYSSRAARQALARLQVADVPVIFCSAKTRAEQTPIRAGLLVSDPFIVENGSAVLSGKDPITGEDGGQAQVFGLPVDEIRLRLQSVRQDSGLHFRSYEDMTVAEVAQLTGLDLPAADRARQRDYSVTVVTPFAAADLARFQAACAQYGLKAPSGGRFYTVTGADADKGRAVRWLVDQYRARWGDDLQTIGIGDSPNDAPLLHAVDRPFLVQRPDGTWRDLDVPNLTRLDAVGPLGFTAMVDRLLPA